MPVTTERLAFYHIPRTGGTWVRNRMGRYDEKTPIKYKNDQWTHEPPIGPPLEGRTSFTIVRDPAKWMASWYRYLVQYEDQFKDRVYGPMMFAGCRRASFRDFIGDYLSKCEGSLTTLWFQFMDNVDVILRTELLEDGLSELFKAVGMTDWDIKLDLGRVKARNETKPQTIATIPAEWTQDMSDRFKAGESDLYDRLTHMPAIGHAMWGGRYAEATTM